MFDLTTGTIDRPFRDKHASATALSIATHMAVTRQCRVGVLFSVSDKLPEVPGDDGVRRRGARAFASSATTAARGQRRETRAGVEAGSDHRADIYCARRDPCRDPTGNGIDLSDEGGVVGGVEGGIPGGVLGGTRRWHDRRSTADRPRRPR